MNLVAAIEHQERLASGFGSLTEDRNSAIDRYLGRPYGDEVEGRSAVVMRDVADTIEWIKPSLLKVFCSGDEVCRFDPTGPEDEPQSEQETDYVNYLINQKNNGFLIFHDWFHDALLQKTGYVLVQHLTEKRQAREPYRGLSDDELAFLVQEGGEVIEHTAYPGAIGILHDVVIQQVREYGCIKVENIPPERVLVASDWPGVSLEGCPFVEVIDWPTISDLRQRGYDVPDDINDVSAYSDDSLSEQARNIELDGTVDREDLQADAATRRVRTRYVWMMIDADEDGIAELHRIVIVGTTILDDEETDIIPVAAITPIRQPHEHYGLSIDDIVQDLQRIRTVLVRGFLDNMYLANNGRNAIDANRVNLEDMLVSRPGGVVRVNGDPGNAIFPLVQPQNGAAILQAVEYVDTVRENRTGVTKYNQGLDANSLNKTAHGISQIMSAAQQRVEMIARIFAETGVKYLMLIVHAMAIKHGSKEEKVKLRNKWVAVDPRSWKTRRDLTIAVGLGTGNKDQMLQHLMMILQAQQQAIQIGVATPKNIYNALVRLTQNAGFKQAEEFWTDPQQNQMPQAPNPEMVKAQAEAQKTQAQLQADAQKFQAQAMLDRERMDFEAQQKELDRQVELEKARMAEATRLSIAELQANTAREQADKAQAFEAEKLVAGYQREDMTKEVGEAKEVEKEDGMSQLLSNLQAAIQGLGEALSRPKTIIRGPDGRAVGVQ